MVPLQLIPGNIKQVSQVDRPTPEFPDGLIHDVEEPCEHDSPVLIRSAKALEGIPLPFDAGEFFSGLSTYGKHDFELHAKQFQCRSKSALIRENQGPESVLFLIEGEVKITMNSINGRRFLLRVANGGEILGLASAISGSASEIRAEARYPCQVASLKRQDFLDLLARYPVASQEVARELSQQCSQVCKRLRILALTSSVPARLACLLLEWSRQGPNIKSGSKIHCSLTQEEIGECIGASRETVTRTFTDFKNHDLVEMRGSTLIIPSLSALSRYGGLGARPDPHAPTA